MDLTRLVSIGFLRNVAAGGRSSLSVPAVDLLGLRECKRTSVFIEQFGLVRPHHNPMPSQRLENRPSIHIDPKPRRISIVADF